MVSWHNEPERNIPRIRRVRRVGKKVLQGSANFQGNSVSLLGDPEELSLVMGQDGVEASQ